MANVKFSGIGVVDMNGSVGNTTFARNFYGTYAKTRVGPPSGSIWLTAWQTEVASLSSVWQFGLTEDERKAWYLPFTTRIDSMAMRNKITGFDFFMSVNLNFFLTGIAPVTVPPISSLTAQPVSLTLTSPAPNTIWVFATSQPFDSAAVYFSFPLPPGRMSFNQIYAYAAYTFANGGGLDCTAIYNGRFGALPTGMKIFCKIVPVHSASGLRGMPYFSSIIIS